MAPPFIDSAAACARFGQRWPCLQLPHTCTFIGGYVRGGTLGRANVAYSASGASDVQDGYPPLFSSFEHGSSTMQYSYASILS